MKQREEKETTSNTFYEFYFPEHDRTVKIDVPFSIEEINILQEARNLLDLLKGEMLKGSGWQRDAYLISVPWGYALKVRKS